MVWFTLDGVSGQQTPERLVCTWSIWGAGNRAFRGCGLCSDHLSEDGIRLFRQGWRSGPILAGWMGQSSPGGSFLFLFSGTETRQAL